MSFMSSMDSYNGVVTLDEKPNKGENEPWSSNDKNFNNRSLSYIMLKKSKHNNFYFSFVNAFSGRISRTERETRRLTES